MIRMQLRNRDKSPATHIKIVRQVANPVSPRRENAISERNNSGSANCGVLWPGFT